MKIYFNDVTEAVVDVFEESLIDMANARTQIYDGTFKDVYQYVIEIDPDPNTLEDYTLEHVNVLYKKGYYLVEIQNNHITSTVEIRENEIQSILIK